MHFQHEQAVENYFIVRCTGVTSSLQNTEQYVQGTRAFVTYSGTFKGYIHRREACRILSVAEGQQVTQRHMYFEACSWG